MKYPVDRDKGRFRKFGYRLENGLIHNGHDFDLPEKWKVYSILDGYVIFASLVNGFGSMNPHKPGGVVVVEYKNKYGTIFTALYGHLNYTVNVGDKVVEGQGIGTVASFYNNGVCLPHLHFAINETTGIPTGKWGYVNSLGTWRPPLTYLKNSC